jgi:hypothetical protein
MWRMKLKAPLKTALRALGKNNVMCASNRRNFLMLEELGLSERYLDEGMHAVGNVDRTKVWYWRLTATGRSQLTVLLQDIVNGGLP